MSWSSPDTASAPELHASDPPSIDQGRQWYTCRPFVCAAHTIAVHTTERDVATRLDALLAALPSPPPDARLPRRDIHISCEVEQPDGGPGPWFELWIDDRYELSSRWLWRCEDRVLGRLNRWTLDATPDRLHLHAGLVSRNDHAVLVVGPSGAGKSTLVAALVLDGWTYHTDEMIGIDLATGALHGHPRALTLKPGSWGLFELPTLRDARRMPSRARAHLPPGELGGASSDAIESCTTIVFVRPGNAWPALETMAPVQAAAGLMAESLDAERAGPAGMQRIVELASTTPSFSLTTGELDATVGLLRPPSPESAVPRLR